MPDAVTLPRHPALLALVTVLTLAACSSEDPVSAGPLGFGPDGPPPPVECSIPMSQIYGGGPRKDGIPAITDPNWVRAGEAGSEYLEPDDRVVGFLVDGEAYAIPLNILWWHEIVNLNLGDRAFSVTHCPLTGSTMAFDRTAVGGAEFGVSGLLYQNNLMMYDRNVEESLWPQMLAGARCGVRDGTSLPMVAVMEMEWAGWKTVHPNSRVVPDRTGWDRNYTAYPYGGYDELNDTTTFFPQEIDKRRPAKERALGVATEIGVKVFPYGALDALGELVTIRESAGGMDVVLFWSREAQGATAFHPVLNGEPLTFKVEDGRIVDEESGTTWRLDGLGTSGPRVRERLVPVDEAFVAYWFAWATFFPDLVIWGVDGDG